MVWGLGPCSRLLVAAGAALLMGAYTHTPAKAADLGGDCCSDLEARVAELEATTVRKGNKKVSVTLYGQVNRAILWWDDHVESNTYAGIDNNYESSRFGFKGSAKIAGDWSGGYRLEVEPTFANSARLNQFNDDNANDALGPMNVRHSFIYLNNKQYGEVRLGLTATPIYNITKDTNVTDLEDTMHSDDRMNQSFFLRAKASPKNAEGLSTFRWSDISRCFESSNAFICSTRKDGVAYWSPTWEGFSASGGWFEDDEWGAALHYEKEWGETFEVGGGIGYAKLRDERLQTAGGGLAGFERDIDVWGRSGSIKHLPTGCSVPSASTTTTTRTRSALLTTRDRRSTMLGTSNSASSAKCLGSGLPHWAKPRSGAASRKSTTDLRKEAAVFRGPPLCSITTRPLNSAPSPLMA